MPKAKPIRMRLPLDEALAAFLQVHPPPKKAAQKAQRVASRKATLRRKSKKAR